MTSVEMTPETLALAVADLKRVKDQGYMAPALYVVWQAMDKALWNCGRPELRDPAVVERLRRERAASALRTTG